MTPGIDVSRAARWLRARGYRIGFRDGGFCECLLESGTERWTGVGRTRRSAFLDALAHAFPSRAAHDLLAAAIGGAPDEERSTAPGKGPDPVPARVPATPPVHAPPIVPAVQSAPSRRFVKQVPLDDAFERFDDLESSMRASIETASMLCPQRQRLMLLAWVAHARNIEESAGEVREALARGKRIKDWARNLSKVWWPGTVRALDPQAAPADSSVDLPGEPSTPLENWNDVALAAEEAVVRMESDDEARGLDPDGWRDAASLEPGPSDPKGLLQEVVAHLEAATAPLVLPEEARGDVSWFSEWVKRPVIQGTPALEWGGIAARLRWLRGHTDESERWGAAVGRLRCIADRLVPYERDEIVRVLDRELDIRRSWADQLGFDPLRKAQQRRRRELLSDGPKEGWSDERILQWIQHAIELKELMTSARIAEALVPVRAQVRAFVVEALPGWGRRDKRRLRSIQDSLSTTAFPLRETTRIDEPAVEPEVLSEDARAEHDRALLAAVLAHTRGKSALVVSNRNDPTLDEEIKKLLELEQVDHGQIEPRRLDSLAERVMQGRYDFVLAATGFMPHKADGILRRASDKSGIHYVRMNRGRPRACLTHLARQLGIAQRQR